MSQFQELARTFLILIEGGPPSNYSAWSPDLPGCIATGATAESCAATMLEAMGHHLETMYANGESLPAGTGPGVYVELQPQAVA